MTENAASAIESRRDWARALAQSLNRLPSVEQRVVAATYFGGRSVAETARELGLPSSVVAAAMASALAALGRAQEE